MDKKELALGVLDAQSACAEFKQAAKNLLDAIGTEKEDDHPCSSLFCTAFPSCKSYFGHKKA